MMASSFDAGVGVFQVWRHNLEDTFYHIRDIVEDYPFISITTLIPGIVARPITHVEYSYHTVKCNVDLLNIIQLGFTFANASGQFPKSPDEDESGVCPSTVQFNFNFNAAKDIQFQEFTNYLAAEGNLDLNKTEHEGIDLHDFGELMFSSGLVMNENIKWVSMHGAYDFGFLLKTLTCTHLPHNTISFKELLNDHFPCLYDLKSLAYTAGLVPNGFISFKEICDSLDLNFEETSSAINGDSSSITGSNMNMAAGINSRNCSLTFFKLIKDHFNNSFIDKAASCGLIYGIDDSIHLSRPVNPSATTTVTKVPSRDQSYDNTASNDPGRNENQQILSSSEPSGQMQTTPKESITQMSKPERLPPGMLRVKPSQISSFSKATVVGSGTAASSSQIPSSNNNNNPPPGIDNSPTAMESTAG